jgi:hypothetical protein
MSAIRKLPSAKLVFRDMVHPRIGIVCRTGERALPGRASHRRSRIRIACLPFPKATLNGLFAGSHDARVMPAGESMATLTIRSVPDKVVKSLKTLAVHSSHDAVLLLSACGQLHVVGLPRQQIVWEQPPSTARAHQVQDAFRNASRSCFEVVLSHVPTRAEMSSRRRRGGWQRGRGPICDLVACRPCCGRTPE